MRWIVDVLPLILPFPHFGVAKEGFHYISYGETEEMMENFFPVMRGVNLNRNYDAGWNEWKSWYFISTIVTSYWDLLLHFMRWPAEYREIEPFSEKENMALRDFIKERDILINTDHHMGLGFYSFGYTDVPPPDEKALASIAKNIAKINGCSFHEAGGGGVTGMAMDWMHESHGIYSFGVEVKICQ